MNEKAQVDALAFVTEVKAKAAIERKRRLQALAKQAKSAHDEQAANVVPLNSVIAQNEKVHTDNLDSLDEKPKVKPSAKDEPPQDEKATGPDLSLKRRAYDTRHPIIEKTIAVLRTLGIHFSYDLFRRRYRVGGLDLEQQFGTAMDGKILVLRTHITERFGFDPRDSTYSAVCRLCLENSFNPVIDYLDSQQWDGRPRLNNWLTTYLGAAPGALNSAFGRKMLIAAVRRIRQPGCKFDQMPVLEGPQDIGKSSAVRILAGDHFRDEEIISKDSREVQELTNGVWLYEMSELAGLPKRDVEHVKNFLSKTHDSARGAYGRVLEDQPRTCIFIGTCNRSDYLSDDSGNRRFWPIPVGKIDLDRLKEDRDQLWAEANMAEAGGEALTLKPELWGKAAVLAASRMADDPWDQTLARIERMPECVSGKFSREFGEMRAASDWLLREVLDLNPNTISSASSRRLGAAMRRLGWTGPKNLRINGEVEKGYCRPAQPLDE